MESHGFQLFQMNRLVVKGRPQVGPIGPEQCKAMTYNEKPYSDSIAMKSKIADSVTSARKSCTCYEMVFEGPRAETAVQR